MTTSRRLTCIATMAAAIAAAGCSSEPEFSLIVRGGMVFGGGGGSATAADVGIKGDRIAAIGNLDGRTAGATIDATGKSVAPGFIDVDSRAGVSLLADGFAETELRQGITTEILGADSPASWTASRGDTALLRSRGLSLDWNGIDGYLRAIESRGTSVNVGTLVPLAAAPPGNAASGYLDAALTAGAFGVVADAESSLDALAEAAAAAARRDAILTVPIENPVTQADESLVVLAEQSKRAAIEGLARLPSGDLSTAFVQRMVTATQRQTTVYGIATPPRGPGASDNSPISAAKYGSVLISPSLARDSRFIELGEGVRRVTSLAASAFQIAQRGIIRENYFADLVVFDGSVEYVVVNGVVVLTPRGLTGSRPGYALRHGPSR